MKYYFENKYLEVNMSKVLYIKANIKPEENQELSRFQIPLLKNIKD